MAQFKKICITRNLLYENKWKIWQIAVFVDMKKHLIHFWILANIQISIFIFSYLFFFSLLFNYKYITRDVFIKNFSGPKTKVYFSYKRVNKFFSNLINKSKFKLEVMLFFHSINANLNFAQIIYKIRKS